jgi:fructose-1,6-bisphosphatase/inositol monophosphatase family enzyme
MAPLATQESVEGGKIPALTADPTWIIDPIDGTTNFVHAFPFSCVSIALAVDKKVVAGVIYDPYKDELFLGAEVRGGVVLLCRGREGSVRESLVSRRS